MKTLLPALALFTAFASLAAQDTRFTREMSPNGKLDLTNVNGAMMITAGTGRTLEVVVTKTVKRGSGDKVKAILEESNGVVRICTIDLGSEPDRTTCTAASKSIHKNTTDEVEMRYTVKLPVGVSLSAATINGSISALGVGRAEALSTVNGDVTFTGTSARDLSTVNGSVSARPTGIWTGVLKLESVNGSVEVSLPANAEVSIRGETVNGTVKSDFSQLISSGGYVGHSLKGTLGKGGRSIEMSTVSGKVLVLRQ